MANSNFRGRVLNKASDRKKKWTKPELKPIGEVRDVAGPNPLGPQGAAAKS